MKLELMRFYMHTECAYRANCRRLLLLLMLQDSSYSKMNFTSSFRGHRISTRYALKCASLDVRFWHLLYWRRAFYGPPSDTCARIIVIRFLSRGSMFLTAPTPIPRISRTDMMTDNGRRVWLCEIGSWADFPRDVRQTDVIALLSSAAAAAAAWLDGLFIAGGFTNCF